MPSVSKKKTRNSATATDQPTTLVLVEVALWQSIISSRPAPTGPAAAVLHLDCTAYARTGPVATVPPIAAWPTAAQLHGGGCDREDLQRRGGATVTFSGYRAILPQANAPGFRMTLPLADGSQAQGLA